MRTLLNDIEIPKSLQGAHSVNHLKRQSAQVEMLPALKSTKIKEGESLNSTSKAYGITKEHTNRELQKERDRMKTKLGNIMYGAPENH